MKSVVRVLLILLFVSVTVQAVYSGAPQEEGILNHMPAILAASNSTPPVEVSDRYDHYNPVAFSGLGVAIVFCTDTPKYDSCKINDQPMYYHGQDLNRHTWRNFESFFEGADTNVGGIIECSYGGEIIQFEVEAYGKQCGSCRVGPC